MTTTITTTKLNNGAVVLAHDKGRGKGDAVSYGNPTQAKARLAKLQAQGVRARIRGVRPVYIVIES